MGVEMDNIEKRSSPAIIKTADYFYDLPKELIAQVPVEDRSSSRLLVMDKHNGALRHDHFRHVIDYLHAGDCLVLNDTRVLPARLLGVKPGDGPEHTQAAVEVLLLKRKADDIWEALVRPGKKLRPGAQVSFGGGLLNGRIMEVTPEGNRFIRFTYTGIFEEILEELGEMPLPPYITRKLQDKNRYQTVYAKYDGSAAAPTAGLHFTEELLGDLREKGIKMAYVTLHVGLGTFRPVKTENILEHHMHSEAYIVTEEAARIITETKKAGGRVICVGTTSCRAIESAACSRRESEDETKNRISAGAGETDIFIYPGYRFRLTDGLITNFHLPESTLLLLVSAMAGREHILAAYAEAVKEKYRFFSFGDAMLIH